ncbi:acyl-CoA dehydrogenase NM domain-like protein [Collybia nuda]|uniref:Acyl-CoA dehydrogenase NM domain-like protein n=1 Tax=Collybia nuda TaxID=64659 RepID=A0A9P5YDX1_9AGAR|nr:acyl-CoA dehydrogenase NM domain-like protein [Collybia nuda]
MRSTHQLAMTRLWQFLPENIPFDDRVELSYERCRSIVQHFNLTVDDVLNITPKYWELHNDPLFFMDGAALTLMTIHYNLCIGTLAMYLDHRPDLKEIIDRLLSFEWNGQFCLTELGHGLDIINMETTASLLPNGEFEINTPVARAAKFMTPTCPSGMPCVSIVHARLFVEEKDHGPKVFLVKLHDGKEMSQGIVSKVLHPRGGSRPMKHCLTYFNHVRVPTTALLGSLERPKDTRAAFFFNISRVVAGTLGMGAVGILGMRISSYIAAKYSQRRRVVDASTKQPREIISFVTQYTPILSTIAQTFVLENLGEVIRDMYVAAKSFTTKHLIAAIFKATVVKISATALPLLGLRCGAQGLFEANQISVLTADMRGATIAEGDVLGLSIRFAIELLLGRLSSPPTRFPKSLLYSHEEGLLMELRTKIASFSDHRSALAERALLPHCQSLIEAIGLRLAYDSAREHDIDTDILDMFVASAIASDASWYLENTDLTREKQIEMEDNAASTLFPRLEDLIERLDVEPYVVAPIVSDKRWKRYVESLETHGGDSIVFDSQEFQSKL